MMGERPPPDPLRFGNTVNVGSSTGWTDEKHMRYITSLEESFVNQLYNGDIDSKGLFCRSPEGYWGVIETDGTESKSSQIEYLESPSCSGFQNTIACYMDYDTSTNCPQLRTSKPAKSKNSGRFAASHLRWHEHSLQRRTESSGQNFIDGETEVTDEHRRWCSEKQHKQKGSASSSRGQGPKRWSNSSSVSPGHKSDDQKTEVTDEHSAGCRKKQHKQKPMFASSSQKG